MQNMQTQLVIVVILSTAFNNKLLYSIFAVEIKKK